MFESLLQLLERFEIAIVDRIDGRATKLRVPSFFKEYLPSTQWPKECPTNQVEVNWWYQFSEQPPEGR